MNRFYLIASAALISIAFSSVDAFAQDTRQREYKSGLKHTYIRKADPAPTPPAAATQTITETTDTVGGKNDAPATTEKPASTVWTKYRALAAGTAANKETETQSANKKPSRPSAPQKPDASPTEAQTQKTAAPSLKPTGIAAIIEDYRKSKEGRSQVKSISINKPSSPQVKKLIVTPPTAPAKAN